MTLSLRFAPIDRGVMFAPGGGLSPREISAEIAAFARIEIAAADAANALVAGAALPHDTFVDGAASDDLERVRPNGTIIAEWKLGTEVVRWAWDQIQALAPVESGRFRASQRLYADGDEVETPEDCAEASVVVIASVAPYARKIEGQFKKPRWAWATNAGGLYHSVAALGQAKFGNIAKIAFTTREITGGATDLAIWSAVHTAALRGRKREKQHARDTRQPAVVITFR